VNRNSRIRIAMIVTALALGTAACTPVLAMFGGDVVTSNLSLRG
jgi:hypothetical protein